MEITPISQKSNFPNICGFQDETAKCSLRRLPTNILVKPGLYFPSPRVRSGPHDANVITGCWENVQIFALLPVFVTAWTCLWRIYNTLHQLRMHFKEVLKELLQSHWVSSCRCLQYSRVFARPTYFTGNPLWTLRGNHNLWRQYLPDGTLFERCTSGYIVGYVIR